MQWAIRITIIITDLFIVTSLGCYTPAHPTSDFSAIPKRGLGEGLPSVGSVPTGDDGPIHFESLYVTPLKERRRVGYYRFWPTGQVLHREAPLGEGQRIEARHGDLIGDRLAGGFPMGLAGSFRMGVVGRYTIVNGQIYIETFEYAGYQDGRHFVVFRGELTENGFVLRQLRHRGVAIVGWWRDMHEPEVHVRHRVGPMKGEPIW